MILHLSMVHMEMIKLVAVKKQSLEDPELLKYPF